MTDTAGAPIEQHELVTVRGTASPAKPSMGVGSTTGLAGVVLAWGAAITAGVAAFNEQGSAFYTDPNVVGVVIAAVVATLGFIASRTSQQNTIVRAAAAGGGVAGEVIEWIEQHADTLDELVAELREQRGKVIAYVPVPPAPAPAAGDLAGDDLPEPDEVDRTVAP